MLPSGSGKHIQLKTAEYINCICGR